MEKANVGVIGLGVMGYGFAMNFEEKGYSVAITNWEKDVLQEVAGANSDKNLIASDNLPDFVNSLEKPRKIVLLVKAGEPTDNTIDKLIPLLDEGDIVVDGGNTHFKESIERTDKLKEYGIHFIGMGVSGGEEGARHGAALMPSGDPEAYKEIDEMLSRIAAKAPQDGEPCVTYIGPKGAGHFVKIIHNGIEYSDSQLIAEAYFLMRHYLELPVAEIAQYFKDWNKGELNSYLIEITGNILSEYDEKTGQPMIDIILDRAKSKGTGKWASQTALDLGMPLSVVTEAVFARYVSDLKEERLTASKLLDGPKVQPFTGNKEEYVEKIRKALYFSKIISYAQGFSVYTRAKEDYGWDLDNHRIAKIFRAGCVIRAELLAEIAKAYEKDEALPNILMDDYFAGVVNEYQTATREIVADAITSGFSVNGFATAMGYFDSYRSENVSANMVQAQRDYFGAHTFERVDMPGDFHHEWE